MLPLQQACTEAYLSSTFSETLTSHPAVVLDYTKPVIASPSAPPLAAPNENDLMSTGVRLPARTKSILASGAAISTAPTPVI